MTIKATSDLWWKNAVIYCLDVETFFDSDGYDVADFYGVDPRLGTLGDLTELLRTARDRGLRVIADLVVNHTSTEHPWFQAARADRGSPYRDFYVWADEQPPGPAEVVFPGEEEDSWTFDEQAGQWYLHRFYRHQPDLNITNPAVRDEIAKVIGFWLQQGLSGFRVDAVPFLIETAGEDPKELPDPHEYLRDLRVFLGRRKGDAALLGEVNLAPNDLASYFGENGDELHMLFNFPAMQALYLSLVREDAGPLREALESLPPAPDDSQWANFVRNHDELTLDKRSEAERQEIFAAFGPDEGMQLYGRGLRRRLPSMLGGDQRRIRMVYSLLFSLPGTPVLFYGEEIGMAENLDVEGRMSVRTPMQWSNEPNAGFSTAPAERLRRPVVEGGFGPARVNVADQRRDPNSLLSWMERLIRQRKECPEFGWGACQLTDTGSPAVFAHRCDWNGRALLALHNLSSKPASITLTIDEPQDCDGLIDLLGERALTPLDGRSVGVDLEGFGYRWYRVHRAGDRSALEKPAG